MKIYLISAVCVKTMNYFSKKNKKFVGKLIRETPKNIWFDELFCLRSKIYAFEGETDIKNKLKGICNSQSKKNKSEENKKCLHGEDYWENVKNLIFVHLIMKCIFNKYANLHKPHMMINDVKQLILKRNFRNETYNRMIMYTHSK